MQNRAWYIILGWPKSSLRFFCKMLLKTRMNFWPTQYVFSKSEYFVLVYSGSCDDKKMFYAYESIIRGSSHCNHAINVDCFYFKCRH